MPKWRAGDSGGEWDDLVVDDDGAAADTPMQRWKQPGRLGGARGGSACRTPLNRHQLRRCMQEKEVRYSSRQDEAVPEAPTPEEALAERRLFRAAATFDLLYPDGIVRCQYCGGHAELALGSTVVSGSMPLARDRLDKQLWVCIGCNSCVGCHAGTDIPLGSLADYTTRSARSRAHRAFDSLWLAGAAPGGAAPLMNRTEAYRWMASSLGIDEHLAHIAAMDAQQCGDLCTLVGALWCAAGQDGCAPL